LEKSGPARTFLPLLQEQTINPVALFLPLCYATCHAKGLLRAPKLKKKLKEKISLEFQPICLPEKYQRKMSTTAKFLWWRVTDLVLPLDKV